MCTDHHVSRINYSLPSSFSSSSSLLSFFSSFSHYLLTKNRMPFLPSSLDSNLLKTPSLPLTSNKFPSFPDQMKSTPSINQMNPYQLIALKARQATKEREAKRKARLLERSSQSSGSGSSGVISSGESSLGSGLFSRKRAYWGGIQPTSTSASLSIPSSSPSTVESCESQTSRDLHTIQPVRILPTTTSTSTQSPLEQASQISNGPVAPPVPNGMNDTSHNTTMEEEDDDADLKRLMNQAQAMLKIADSPSQTENGSQKMVNSSEVLVNKSELDMGTVVSTSVLPDPNDEKR
jgi:hypothetical protein